MNRRQLFVGLAAVPIGAEALAKPLEEEFYLPTTYQCNVCLSIMLVNADNLDNVTIECASYKCKKNGIKYKMPVIGLQKADGTA